MSLLRFALFRTARWTDGDRIRCDYGDYRPTTRIPLRIWIACFLFAVFVGSVDSLVNLIATLL